MLDRITGVLEDSSSAKTYDGTPGNPTEEAVAEALEFYQENGCDGLVCVGGGSPMDLGKAVALLADSGGPLAQYDPLKGETNSLKASHL